jgi:hypothetical protein
MKLKPIILGILVIVLAMAGVLFVFCNREPVYRIDLGRRPVTVSEKTMDWFGLPWQFDF